MYEQPFPIFHFLYEDNMRESITMLLCFSSAQNYTQCLIEKKQCTSSLERKQQAYHETHEVHKLIKGLQWGKLEISGCVFPVKSRFLPTETNDKAPRARL